MLKLNLGCGHSHLDGWVNVDKHPTPSCDQIVDLEILPWPWPDNSVDEILLNHVLEHLGGWSDLYLGIIKEIWRVCNNRALVSITVPHTRHDHFLSDATHVRAITWEGLCMFSQEENQKWIATGSATTPLGIQIGVDFHMEGATLVLDEPWAKRQREGTITDEELHFAAKHYNNVIMEIKMSLRALKPS